MEDPITYKPVRANQWTGFYMIGASIIKELIGVCCQSCCQNSSWYRVIALVQSRSILQWIISSIWTELLPMQKQLYRVFCKKGVKVRKIQKKKKKKKKKLPQAYNFIKKETLAQVFSCEFWEIFKNTFFSKNTSGGCFCLWIFLLSKFGGHNSFWHRVITFSNGHVSYNDDNIRPFRLA